MTHPSRRELIEAIEAAARSSTPMVHEWQIGLFEITGDPDDKPGTLEDFVSNTYIGKDGANRTFRAAAEAAADAVLALLAG